MAGDDENESPDIYDEHLLAELEKESETDDVADDYRNNSAPSSAHWSSSWSKPTEVCTNAEEPLFSLLPDDFTSEEKPHIPAQFTVGAGLENLGNTCFLNSVLQCFIHTVPLLQPILSDGCLAHSSNNCDKEQFCLLYAFRDLIQRSLVSNTTMLPWDLVNNLTHISSNFKRFQQEDAHEYFQCFLDRLESCNVPESKHSLSTQCNNIVQEVFGGCLISNLKCCNCGHSSDTYEPSIDLSLEIDYVDNLFTALHSFTKAEKIEDPETKFTCEKCKEQVYVEKKLSFDQVPSVAVLHLKRFKNDGCFVEKIDKHVAFPLDLDLEPFTATRKHNYADLQYVLYAVVVHIGLRPTSGHYYCFIRLSSDMWCKFDDSKVELVPEDYVLSQEAYVLFYAKKSTPWFSSFIETQTNIINSTIQNTSPKSVLDNIDTSVSPNLTSRVGCSSTSNDVSYHIGSTEKRVYDNEIKDSGPVQSDIKEKARVCDLKASVAPYPRDSSSMSLSKGQKLSQTLPEKVSGLQNNQIDIDAVFRSPSPEIYSEDSPGSGFIICRSHLRSAERLPCKRRLEEKLDDEMKHAHSFIKKNVPSARREQLMAALRGSKSEPPLDRKKTRRLIVK